MSRKKYHPYVFNEENRTFVGAFEEMYQAESRDNFDSWHQDDLRAPHRKILLALAESLSYDQVIDLGCGKGSLTQCFKTINNRVFGFDIAPTAIAIASERFPDIQFASADLGNPETAKHVFASVPEAGQARLVLCVEVLSYMSNWQELLALVSHHCDFLLLSLYIPENPIGFVKSAEELSETVDKHFHILEEIRMKVERFQIILAKRK